MDSRARSRAKCARSSIADTRERPSAHHSAYTRTTARADEYARAVRGGFIFLASEATVREVLAKRLFALPARHLADMREWIDAPANRADARVAEAARWPCFLLVMSRQRRRFLGPFRCDGAPGLK